MNQGTVKFYDEKKGLGLIKDSDSGNVYLVLSYGLIDNIKENDNVTFDLEQGKKDLNAVNVKLVY